MNRYSKTAIQAMLAGATLLCAMTAAQAIEVGACVAKSELNNILAQTGQVKVVGALEKAAITSGGQQIISEIKVTFTTGIDKKTGWMLKEDGCLPANTLPDDKTVTGVRYYMALRDPRVFDYESLDIPAEADYKQDGYEAERYCEAVHPAGTPKPSNDTRLDVNRTRKLVESLDDYSRLAVDRCLDAELMLLGESSEGHKVLFRAETVHLNGDKGPTLIVMNSTADQVGEVILINRRGAAVDADIFSETVYINGYQKFVVR